MFLSKIKLKKINLLRIIMEPKCPECGSMKIRKNIGEIVCRKCGFVIEDGIVVCG